jgi:uncharacterized membrane protein
MELSEVTIMIISIIACIFSIASTAMGVEAYNKNDTFRKDNMHNYTFLIINLVVAIIVLLLSFVGLFLHFKK